MRIHTPKLKAPSPIVVLLICLIWPLAAVVGTAVSDAPRATPENIEHSSAQNPHESIDRDAREHNTLPNTVALIKRRVLSLANK